ncbi:hypothetical protein BLNAU_23653 [Blattamonas nauphoetae]|uniref:Uncharacterized protein n=1 Tax=Blattamonas nauphoetae TaxID=2049346 RepID=A0ABQ9WPN2_9EUKA|nr:hypothetical protein BLNAU_23653 [Blattamonas nauphoetae]
MDVIVNTEIQNLLIKWMTLAINSFVHFAKSKVLETIEGGRKMIERNTTILTMTDMILFHRSSTNGDVLANHHPPLTSPRSLSICGSRAVPWRRATCHPSHLRADQAAKRCSSIHQRSLIAATIVKKTINHSLSIFNQSAKARSNDSTSRIEADKADTLSEMIMVRVGRVKSTRTRRDPARLPSILSRAALFVAGIETVSGGRNCNFNGRLDQIHHEAPSEREDRPDFLVFSGPTSW